MELSLEPIILSKELILHNVTEEQIFEHYGVAIRKGLFCSKLRKDAQPTVAFYRNKSNRLMLKDFGDNSCHDCFSYVQELFHVSYYMALQIIANDFGIINRPNLTKNKPKLKYSGEKIEKTEEARIRVEIRDFDKIDLDWWGKYGISEKTLKKFKVYAIKYAWLNENLFYIFSENQRVYGYYGGTKDGIEYWRLYFPGRKKWKFIANWKSSMIQGAHLLNKIDSDYIVITKSMKDVMTLYELGVPAIAPCSENIFVSDIQYEKLKKKFKRIKLFFDNDLPGISAANKIHKKYSDVKILYLPIHGGDKDISDYHKAHGRKKTLELIENTKRLYGEN